MLHPLRNQKGSAVMWVLLTALILLVLAASMLALGAYYHNSSIRELDRDQAYLTARAGAEAVALGFCDPQSNARMLDQMQTGESYPVTDLEGLPAGECEIEATRADHDTVVVRATASSGEARVTVRVVVALTWSAGNACGTVTRYEE